jgi:hypothetical protein
MKVFKNRHYDNTNKDFTYKDFTYNDNNKCDITFIYFFYSLL